MGPSALLFLGAYYVVKMALFTTTIVNVQVTFKVNYDNKKKCSVKINKMVFQPFLVLS